MKKLLVLVTALLLVMAPSMFANGQQEKVAGEADKYEVGVSMALFADNWLTYLRDAIDEYAAEIDDLDVFIEDANNDTQKQLAQVENFIAQGYDAIIVNAVDTDSTYSITQRCENAGIPLIYVNRVPNEELPEGVYLVVSNELVSGKLQAEILAEKLGGEGNVVIMLGELSHSATHGRTTSAKEVFAKYPGINIIDEQTANFQRDQALDLMSNWLLAGLEIDAVAANNDEMAIGAIIALENAGKNPNKDVWVGGIDATADALDFMKDGKLTVTVFQNAEGQGRGAIDTAYRVLKGETIEQTVWIPFEQVTEDNYMEYRKILGLKE